MPCTPLADIAGQANRAVVGGTKAESRHFLLEAKWELRYVPLTIGICAMPSDAEFTVRPDAKGRVTLGALAKGVSSYRISKEADGRLLLEPYVEIPARERWVYDNPQALASLERGIADAAAGRVKSRGSFAKYLKE